MSSTLKIFIALILVSSAGCKKKDLPDLDFKQEMRDFVKAISADAKSQNSDFIIIPQNGQELVHGNGETDGKPVPTYMNAIDGIGREDLFYGADADDAKTTSSTTSEIRVFLDVAIKNNITILVTDYCFTKSKMDDSYVQNAALDYISFAADHRELDNIPDYPVNLKNQNADSIVELSDAKNFLYLINPGEFASKQALIGAIIATNYDVLLMDFFFEDETFTSAEIDQLREKANGGSRLVISYMSIGEAEDYRYYWKNDWNKNAPSWLDEENKNFRGNFKVRYWEQEWKDIIYGNNSSYLQKILDKGFDGVYLDLIDAFYFFEEQ